VGRTFVGGTDIRPARFQSFLEFQELPDQAILVGLRSSKASWSCSTVRSLCDRRISSSINLRSESFMEANGSEPSVGSMPATRPHPAMDQGADSIYVNA